MDPVATSLAILFRAPQVVDGALTMLGIIESTGQKLDKLINTEFDVGVRHLRELSVADSQAEFILGEAWRRFAAAVQLETGERKALAYLGLAFSQYRLGEQTVALATLKELSELEYKDKTTRAARTAAVAVAPVFALPVLLAPLAVVSSIAASVAMLHPDTRQAIAKADLEKLRHSFYKWFSSIPSEQRVEQLKTQAKAFIASETE